MVDRYFDRMSGKIHYSTLEAKNKPILFSSVKLNIFKNLCVVFSFSPDTIKSLPVEKKIPTFRGYSTTSKKVFERS